MLNIDTGKKLSKSAVKIFFAITAILIIIITGIGAFATNDTVSTSQSEEVVVSASPTTTDTASEADSSSFTDRIAQSLAETFSAAGIPNWLVVALISMIPLLELRGSILVAGILLKMSFIPTYVAAVLGNMVPIPFILLFIRAIFKFMEKIPGIGKFPAWCEKHAMKHSDQIEKYGYFGLFLFVAIPLPGTGGWTGALLSVLFSMDFKKSLLAIFLGVMGAGVIMSIVAFGASGIIGLFS